MDSTERSPWAPPSAPTAAPPSAIPHLPVVASPAAVRRRKHRWPWAVMAVLAVGAVAAIAGVGTKENDGSGTPAAQSPTSAAVLTAPATTVTPSGPATDPATTPATDPPTTVVRTTVPRTTIPTTTIDPDRRWFIEHAAAAAGVMQDIQDYAQQMNWYATAEDVTGLTSMCLDAQFYFTALEGDPMMIGAPQEWADMVHWYRLGFESCANYDFETAVTYIELGTASVNDLSALLDRLT